MAMASLPRSWQDHGKIQDLGKATKELAMDLGKDAMASNTGSSEMDKLQCITNTEHSPDTKITVMGTRFPAQEF